MLLRYTASADNTIVNAYQPNLIKRGTGSNAGRADIVEVFSIYGRETSPGVSGLDGSQELSRYLVKFPIDTISADRTADRIPIAGSVSFYLKMSNAQTSKTVPRQYTLGAHKITEEWEEGVGLDLDEYRDLVKGKIGSDWIQRKKDSDWTDVGGTYSTAAGEYFEQYFETGLEDMEVDITSLVEQWIATPATNYGVLVKLTSSCEAYFSSSDGLNSGSLIHNPNGALLSYYTKRFFARGSQYFYKKPTIEARWSDIIRDDRSRFYYSSSRAPAADNLNTLYFYNVIRGRLANLPTVGTGDILLSLYGGNSADSAPSGSALDLYDGNTNITGGYVSTGIYSASVAITSAATPLSTLYDIWHSSSVQYYTSSLSPKTLDTGATSEVDRYYINISNFKEFYSTSETVRLNLFSRAKNWEPTIYTVANSTPEALPIYSASYRAYRLIDGYQVIPYGTGSDQYTVLSYDVAGNYFKIDMSLFEPGYAYALKFAVYDAMRKSWEEQQETFKFKVVEF